VFTTGRDPRPPGIADQRRRDLAIGDAAAGRAGLQHEESVLDRGGGGGAADTKSEQTAYAIIVDGDEQWAARSLDPQ